MKSREHERLTNIFILNVIVRQLKWIYFTHIIELISYCIMCDFFIKVLALIIILCPHAYSQYIL